jgi:fumarate reductase subunit D
MLLAALVEMAVLEQQAASLELLLSTEQVVVEAELLVVLVVLLLVVMVHQVQHLLLTQQLTQVQVVEAEAQHKHLQMVLLV